MDYFALNCLCVSSGKREDNLINEKRNIIKENYTLFYVTSGKGKIIIDGIGFCVRTGQSFLVFPLSNARLEPDEKNPWEYSWVEFRGLEAALLIKQTSLSKKLPVVDEMPIINFDFLFDIEDCGSEVIHSKCRASGKLIVLLSYYVEHFPCREAENVDYVIMARNYVERNYRNPDFNVQKVADHVKIDRTYLYRLFKAETGMSVIDYINNCRISKASVLLIDESISIKDVAYSVGFTDQMYFSKVFKRLKGKTPTEFRRENNGRY